MSVIVSFSDHWAFFFFFTLENSEQFLSKDCNICSFIFFSPGDHNVEVAGTYTSEVFREHLQNVDTQLQVFLFTILVINTVAMIHFWSTRTDKCRIIVKTLVLVCDPSLCISTSPQNGLLLF